MALRYLVQTFGCQMNVHDSDRMDEVLLAHGFERADRPEDCDLIVFNTCSVREKAEQKLRSEVGKVLPLKRARPDLVVCVAGCVAQQEGEALLKRVAHIDLVIGPDNIAELPVLVHAQLAGAPPVARTVFDLDAPRFLAADPRASSPASAFVTTMKGCDERCSFCVVPYTRGPERYRPAQEIVDEVTRWVMAGAREVVLLGQTVDSYRDDSLPPPASDADENENEAGKRGERGDESQFPHLLRALAHRVPAYDARTPDAPGLARLRYTSPHPRHATASLARAHAELDVLARHIHLPVQSGSDRVLRRMIRRYTRADYVARARRLLAARPDMTLSTDVIVGFPGETDDDFEATLSLVREVGFVSLFGFKYSPRPFTPALKLGDDVPEAVKSERLARLFALAEEQGKAHLSSLVGATEHVLIEGASKSSIGQGVASFQGRTARSEIVHVAAQGDVDLVGQLVKVKIVGANKHSLSGELAEPLAPRAPRPKHETRARRVALAVLPQG